MLHWLKEQYQCEVVCYCADVGQGAEMDGLEEKAKATGASKLTSQTCGKSLFATTSGQLSRQRSLRRRLPDGTSLARAGDR